MKYFNILNCSGNITSCCTAPGIASFMVILKRIIELIRIIVPILLILMITIEVGKIMMNPDDKKKLKSVYNKVLATIIIFLLPTILNAILNSVEGQPQVIACWNAAQDENRISIASSYIVSDRDKNKKSLISDEGDYESGSESKNENSSEDAEVKESNSSNVPNNVSQEKQKYLDGIIELPSSNYDKKEANNMINRLSLFDIKFLKLIYNKKGLIILCNGPITNDNRFSNLKGKIPRGWEGTGYTWDDVPGFGDYPETIIRIGKSFPSYKNNHSAIVLELHETAHMIDALLQKPSFSKNFINITSKESDSLFPNDDYLDISEEYWAESLAYYTYTEKSRNKLKKYAPKTYDYFVKLIDSL